MSIQFNGRTGAQISSDINQKFGEIEQIANDAISIANSSSSVQVASQQEVNTGENSTKAVTPLTLDNKLRQQLFTKQYIDVIQNIDAGVPFVVNHGLGLIDRNAFVINTMHSNSSVRFGVDSVDNNSLTLTSLVNLQNVFVIVIGATNPNQEAGEDDFFGSMLDLNQSDAVYDLMTASGLVDLNA